MINNNLKLKINNRGVTLYLTMLILAILMSSVLTLTGIINNQMKVIFNLGDAVTAFSAADAGIEKALYNIRILEVDGRTDFPINFDNGAVVDVIITITEEETIIKSIGSFNTTQRAIEARY